MALILTNYDASNGDARLIDVGTTETSVLSTTGTDETERLAAAGILVRHTSGGTLVDLVGSEYVLVALSAVDAPLYSESDQEAF